jgi:hypothetical protein
LSKWVITLSISIKIAHVLHNCNTRNLGTKKETKTSQYKIKHLWVLKASHCANLHTFSLENILTPFATSMKASF